MTDQDAVLAFTNTHGFGRGPDRLADAASMLVWLDEVAWLGDGAPAPRMNDGDAARARALRDALLVVLRAHAHDPDLDPADAGRAAAVVARAAERAPLVVDLGGDAAALRGDGVLGRLFAAIGTLALSGRWPRMKACRNAPCHRAFADRTRNTSAAYCRPQCSGQVSMRAHRARQRGEG